METPTQQADNLISIVYKFLQYQLIKGMNTNLADK